MKRKILFILLALSFAPFLQQPLAAADKGKPAPYPAVPLPTQIGAAKKVFIANLGGEYRPIFEGGKLPDDGDYSQRDLTPNYSHPGETYARLYSALYDWSRFDLVGTPGEADLIFELQFLQSTNDPESRQENGPHLRLVIVDPKTHTPLWGFTEVIEAAGSMDAKHRSYLRAVNNLVLDVKDLARRASPPIPLGNQIGMQGH